VTASLSEADSATVGRLIRQLGRFDGSLEQFLENVLAVECLVTQTESGAFLRSGDPVRVAALYPRPKNGGQAPAWVGRVLPFVAEAAAGDRALVKPLQDTGQLYGQPANLHVVLLPHELTDAGRIVGAFLVKASRRNVLEARCVRLELIRNLLNLFENRLSRQKEAGQEDVGRLGQALGTLAAINRYRRFTETAMAFCNEVASLWGCERVSIGFLKGRYVHVKAMSHTEDFSRKVKVVQELEAAMEECLDQDVEVLYPAPEGASYVSRATEALARGDGPPVVLSLPLRRDGEAVGVVTLQRAAERDFGLGEVETARLACDLTAPRLASLHEHDRWFGARAAAAARRGVAAFLGPKHTWAKVTGILAFAAVVFLVFARGEYRPEAPFVLEAIEKQVVPAPFDGYLKEVGVEVGDVVEAGTTVLARLDTAELRLQLAAASAEKVGHLKQAAAAMRDGRTAEAQIAQASAEKVGAQIDLLAYRIEQATLASPLSGAVVTGDLKRSVGAPVTMGDVLFEVASLDSLRAELQMPEDQIVDIETGQTGSLATASYPAQRIGFVVERINPAAEVVNQRNVFKVRVRLAELRPWMRPGMEGVAKVNAGSRLYAWIWTRRIVNWIRMKLWI
jgi:biotin carboxyl carrier protein